MTTASSPPPATAPLYPPARMLRLVIIAAIVGGMLLLFAYAGGWLTPRTLTPEKIINRFQQINGITPGFRRNHAKGVGFSGHFDSNGNGVELSRAVLFTLGRTPVLGRFALAGGQPYAADAAHTVRSMALLFQLSSGEQWRTGMNNIPVFPVNSARGFYDLLLASAPDPSTGKSDPEKMQTFFSQHPDSAPAFKLLQSAPITSGFADTTYNSLNAFLFTNGQGKTVPVRWSMVPVQPLPSPAGPAADKNYLFDALIAAEKEHPLQWRLVVTIADPGDPTNDATLPWPPGRRQVDVGTLTIDTIESEDTSPARDINYDPLVLPDGIAGSDDPLLSARSAAYAWSYKRREGEARSPAAVSHKETAK